MALISIRLPEKLDAELSREAKRANRPRSEMIREAIADYLTSRKKARFLGEIARAAAEPGEDAVALAEEALPLDNEALELALREPAPPRYRARRRKA